MKRRAVLGSSLLLLAMPAARAQKSAAFRELTWDDLMPRDWDPLKDFKGLNLGMLQDGDPRATQLLTKMRAVWDKAPTNAALDGKPVRLPGYIVPLEESKAGLSEFLLVPYFGACIHTPPPPANQIVHVLASKPLTGLRSMDAVWVDGTMRTVRGDSFMGASGYRMDLVGVEKISADKPAK